MNKVFPFTPILRSNELSSFTIRIASQYSYLILLKCVEYFTRKIREWHFADDSCGDGNTTSLRTYWQTKRIFASNFLETAERNITPTTFAATTRALLCRKKKKISSYFSFAKKESFRLREANHGSRSAASASRMVSNWSKSGHHSLHQKRTKSKLWGKYQTEPSVGHRRRFAKSEIRFAARNQSRAFDAQNFHGQNWNHAVQIGWCPLDLVGENDWKCTNASSSSSSTSSGCWKCRRTSWSTERSTWFQWRRTEKSQRLGQTRQRYLGERGSRKG